VSNLAEVACLGILVADVYGLPIDEWPQRGRLSLVDEIGIGLGGCAANTGLSLRRLGVDTAVIGKVGDDGLGRFVHDALTEAGIDPAGIVVDSDSSTSATMVIIDSDGERTFLHCVGANGKIRVEDIDMELARGAKVFHCAGAFLMPGFDGEPMAQIQAAARAQGATTSLDTAWDDTGSWLDTLAPCLPYTQIFLPSLAEAEQLTGLAEPAEIAKALMDMGVEIVALKMGPDGSYVADANDAFEVQAYQVQPIDGTGAGDAYVAGFLRAHLAGWDLERTAKFANAVGALCTTGLGTTAGVRNYPDTIQFLKGYEPDYWADY